MIKSSLLQEIGKLVDKDTEDLLIIDPYQTRLKCVCKLNCDLSPWELLFCFVYNELTSELIDRVKKRKQLLEKKGVQRKIVLIAPTNLKDFKDKDVFDQIIDFELLKADGTCKNGTLIPPQFNMASEVCKRFGRKDYGKKQLFDSFADAN